MNAIYLDHAATTPVLPEVWESMMPFYTEHFGNASSLHGFGRKARQALTSARDSIADVLGCSSGQLFFTSGGTESDNLAIIGAAEALRGQGKAHVVTTAIEHHAVLDTCQYLQRQGFKVDYIQPNVHGQVSAIDVAAAIRADTAIVSVMHANNEVGTLQPIKEIGNLCRDKGVIFHVDAVQSLGAIPIDLSDLPVDLMSLTAHKIGGPKGIGLLYCGKEVPLTPLLHGGSQERKKRPGTENVAGAVGFARALDIASSQTADKQVRMSKLRERFLTLLSDKLGEQDFVVNGHPTERLDSIVNVSFPGIDKETMLMNLDLYGIAASGGSACTSGSLTDSHVLKAMGLRDELVKSAIRFSFGSSTTEQNIVDVVQKTETIVNRLRST